MDEALMEEVILLIKQWYQASPNSVRRAIIGSKLIRILSRSGIHLN